MTSTDHQLSRQTHAIINRQESRIHRLPFDILYAIFLICLLNEARFPMVACSVCHSWRKIAIQTKPFWTKIEFFDSSSADLEWARQRLWIERSGSCLLDLIIRHDPTKTKRTLKVLKSIFQVIMPHSSRWKSFALDKALPPKTLRVLGDRLRDGVFPSLESMTISGHNFVWHWRGPLFLHPTPRLKELTIHQLPVDYTASIFDNLTKLSLREPRPMDSRSWTNLIVSLLFRSPELQELDVNAPPSDTRRWRSIPTLPAPDYLVHSKIVTLRLPAALKAADLILHMKLPSLTELELTGGFGISSSILTSILTLKPFTKITHISLYCHPEGPAIDHLWMALESMPLLESVDIQQYDFEEDSEWGLDTIGRICPRLENLNLFLCFGVIYQTLREMVSIRQEAANMTSLKRIGIWRCRTDGDSVALAWLMELPELDVVFT